MAPVHTCLKYKAIAINKQDPLGTEQMMLDEQMHGSQPVFIRDGIIVLEETSLSLLDNELMEYEENEHGSV